MLPRFFFRKNKDLTKDGKLMCVIKLSDLRGKEYSQEFDTGIFISRAQYDLDHSQQRADVTATLQILQSHLVVKLGRPCTARELKDAYLKRNVRETPAPVASVVLVRDVFAAFIEANKHKKESTQKSYKYLITMLEDTCQWLPQIPARDMDIKQAERVFETLSAKYQASTPYMLLSACNIALNYGHKTKMFERNTFGNFKPKPYQAEIISLTDEEVEKIKNAPRCMALDLFVFMLETGLSYVDTQNFKMIFEQQEDDIFFTGKRQKTGGSYFGRLGSEARHILEKYGQQPPKMHYQAFRKSLIIALKKCGITKPITAHKARHTLAAKVIRETGNLSLVADMLGDTVGTVQKFYGKMTVKGFAEKLKRSGLK